LPAIQSEILWLPHKVEGRSPIMERALRQLSGLGDILSEVGRARTRQIMGSDSDKFGVTLHAPAAGSRGCPSVASFLGERIKWSCPAPR